MAVLETRSGAVAGLLTDVNLGPGPSGWELAARARQLNPSLPVVYITGEGDRDWPSSGAPNSRIVTKPFVSAEILMALSRLRYRPELVL
jgi:FixJ family two-component response regulator